MVKKIIALVLVLGVIGGIIGCSGGGDTGPATPEQKGGTGANAGAAGGTTA